MFGWLPEEKMTGVENQTNWTLSERTNSPEGDKTSQKKKKNVRMRLTLVCYDHVTADSSPSTVAKYTLVTASNDEISRHTLC